VASGEWLEFPLKCNSFGRIDATCILGQGFEMHERRRRYHMHALKGNELPPEVEYLILLLNGDSGN
jgi:hypothetical protein